MRCLVWRGPKGLVPARAAQTPPAAIAPPVLRLPPCNRRKGQDARDRQADKQSQIELGGEGSAQTTEKNSTAAHGRSVAQARQGLQAQSAATHEQP